MWNALLPANVKAAAVAAFLQEASACPTVVSRCPYAKPTVCTVVMRHPDRPKLVKQFFYDFEGGENGERRLTTCDTYAGRVIALAVAIEFNGTLHFGEDCEVLWVGAPPVLPPPDEIFAPPT